MTTIDLSTYQQTFSEDFNSLSVSPTGQGTTWASMRSEWRYDASSEIGFGNSSFVDPSSGYNPFGVNNGILTITAVPDRTPSGLPGNWESGLLTTQGGFSQTYGYFEVRADFSGLPGAWDAFWLLPDHTLPDAYQAGHWQELDIVEHYGISEKSVFNVIHTTDPGPNANWQSNLQTYSEMASPAGFHTYGMEWNQNVISFYVDRQLVGSKPTPSDMHGPMYLLLDLATQADPNNNVTTAGVPVASQIDYVRVYSRMTASSPSDHGTGQGPVAETIGSGADKLVLSLSQDAYAGDAQYTVWVDGMQIGGMQTAHASHAAGQSDLLTVQGNWGGGHHDVGVVFLNDAWDGTHDRNLYVDGATYNGATIGGAAHALMSAGDYHFAVDAPTNTGSGSGGSSSGSSGGGGSTSAATIGSGADRLVLSLSQDQYAGDAQYTVWVDGTQVGGVQTAHSSHAAGQSDRLTVQGDWGGGHHDVGVVFLNDAWDGTHDRNLYVDGAAYNGATIGDAAHALMSAGDYHFGFDAPTGSSNGSVASGSTVGSGPDKLVLSLSQDEYAGDAQYTVWVDGAQVGGVQTAQSSHASGRSDLLTVQGNWGAGRHDAEVIFLNDAWDGTHDRNLYVDGATYNGATVGDAAHTLWSAGSHHFSFLDI